MNDNILARKERERQHRRGEIITAAKDVFAARGYSEATLEEIAARAEFGKGTLYNYFEGKHDLYAAVIADCFDHCQRIAEETLSDSGNGFRDAAHRFASSLLQYFYGNLGAVAMLMSEMNSPHEMTHIRERYAALVGRLERSVVAAVESGEMKSCRTGEVASLFFSMIFMLFHTSIDNPCGGSIRNADSVLPTDDEHVQGNIRRVLTALDLTFFHGVLQQQDSTMTLPTTL